MAAQVMSQAVPSRPTASASEPSAQLAADALPWRVLPLLLSYPTEELVEATAEIRGLLSIVDPHAVRQELEAFVGYLETNALTELQEFYVSTFDRTRSLSLHLFEHTHGDARERGQAMVRLGQLYSDNGWELEAKELPDYLPLLCEFVGLVDAQLRQAVLREARPVIEQLHQRLLKRKVPHASLLSALLELIEGGVSQDQSAVVEEDGHALETSFQALDAQYEERPVTFSLGAAHDSLECGSDSSQLVSAAKLVRR